MVRFRDAALRFGSDRSSLRETAYVGNAARGSARPSLRSELRLSLSLSLSLSLPPSPGTLAFPLVVFLGWPRFTKYFGQFEMIKSILVRGAREILLAIRDELL